MDNEKQLKYGKSRKPNYLQKTTIVQKRDKV
jgi:hypothetical protein